MSRIANPGYFRAEAVGIDWAAIAKGHGEQLLTLHRQAAERGALTLRLSWACHGDLGVPHGVFTVWRRPVRKADAKPVETTAQSTGNGSVRVDWGTPAGRVVVDCGVADPSKPVIVKLCWRTGTKESVTAIESVGPGDTAAHLDLRTGGATCAILTNAVDPVVRIASLDEIVNAPDWEPLEYVGLPVPKPGMAGTDYDGFDQGLVTAIMPAPDAAIDRLRRGCPPLGWFPVLPSGAAAPPWQAPDPDRFVEALGTQLLDKIAALYAPGLPENLQAGLTNRTAVDGPANAGQPASIDAAPWPLLAVPAMSDAFANLALGFGTAYPVETGHFAVNVPAVPEFLVTANYLFGPVFRASGPGWNVETQLPAGEYAAYAPAVGHALTPAPLPYTAARYSVQPPTQLDAPWRENVRTSWPPLSADAGAVHVTQFAPVRTALGAAVAEPLFALDPEYDGWRVPNVPPLAADEVLLSTVDPVAEIPLGSGGRQEVYAAALSDVYGVWSPWSEGVYPGMEPPATPPALANLKLASHYAGAPQCPATLEVEVMLEWQERSTSSVDFSAIFFPMGSPSEQPPAGIGAESVPAGSQRQTFSISFAGDVPTGIACTVSTLDENGLPTPMVGPGQGEPRRFAVHVDLPPVDFAVTDRWGVELWARRTLVVGPSPTAWAPDDSSRAMLASVGSPVPVIPVTVPLPGVPLASLPDSDGRAHVKIVWGAPAMTNVKTFVIWQASEEYLRERCGGPDPAPGTVAGARLVSLRQLLVDHPEQCRLAFRRVVEVPGDRREADVALARGAAGIQFFVVTSTTKTGADAPWPYNSAAQDVTQVFMAPRVVRPGQPLARPAITSAGVRVDLEVPSEVPVSRFRVYGSHNFDAARRADSMGAPQFATATAPEAGVVDVLSGHPVYHADWSGALAPSWKQWYLRTVAEPDTSSIPERGWRAMLSPESDVVTVRVPPSMPPDLDPLIVESVSPDHTVLVARTSTSAPIPDTDFGPHRVGGLSGDTVTVELTAAAALYALSAVPATDPSPLPTAGTTIVTRGERTGGRTPLAIWFTRVDAAATVEVGVRLVDPLGRAGVQVAQVPGWTAPTLPDLHLVAVTAVSATASVVTVSSTELRTANPPFVLTVSGSRRFMRSPIALPRISLPAEVASPLGPLPQRAIERPPIMPTMPTMPVMPHWPTITASIELPAIRPDGGRRGPIILPWPARSGIRFSYRADANGAMLYDIYIPLAAPFSTTVTLTSPEGPHASVRADG